MLTVLAPGPLATVQDRGRPGWAGIGVPRSGAADRAAHDLANRLVGNDPAAAAVDVQGCRGPGDRDEHGALGPKPQTTGGHLDHRSRRVVAHEPVRERGRIAVGGAGPGHPDRRPAHAAEVLDRGQRPRGEDGQHGGSTVRKRTRVPGRSRAGGSRSTSKRTASVRPTSCQPPGEARG